MPLADLAAAGIVVAAPLGALRPRASPPAPPGSSRRDTALPPPGLTPTTCGRDWHATPPAPARCRSISCSAPPAASSTGHARHPGRGRPGEHAARPRRGAREPPARARPAARDRRGGACAPRGPSCPAGCATGSRAPEAAHECSSSTTPASRRSSRSKGWQTGSSLPPSARLIAIGVRPAHATQAAAACPARPGPRPGRPAPCGDGGPSDYGRRRRAGWRAGTARGDRVGGS